MKKQFSLKLATRTMVVALAILLTASLVNGTATINVYLDDLPASATYVIKTDGTNYWAVRYDGYKAYDSTNASYVINSARTGLGSLATGAPGTISLQKGTYTLNKDIIIGKLTHLLAESGTIISVSANLDHGAIVIDSTSVAYTDWKIENFHIDMNGYNGNGIYSSSASRTDSKNKESIYNVYIEDIKAGYAGIDLTNALYFDFSQIRIASSGNGIVFRLDGTLISGNGILDDAIIGLSANNGVGFLVLSDPAKRYNVMTINRLQVGGGLHSLSNLTGVWLKNVLWSTWNTLDLEGNTINLLLNNSRGNVFNDLFAWTNKTTSANVKLIGTSYNNQFNNPWVDSESSGQTAWNDSSTSSTQNKNLIKAGMFRAYSWSPFINTVFDKTAFYNYSSAITTVSRYRATTTVANLEWMSHNLPGSPTTVTISLRTITYGTPAVPVIAAYTSANSTKWRVSVYWANGTAITADAITIEWVAYYYEL